jgi:hydrogenase/urease accessory protein HupE
LSATSTALFYRVLLVSALLCAPTAVRADVFRPAYLELRETGADQYDVLWKVPAQGELRLAMAVRFPDGTTNVTEPRSVMSGTAWTERWRVQRTGGLVGQTIGIDGLPGGVTDVVVRVERADGSTQVERLAPERPEFRVTAPAGINEIAWSYLVLGVEHILGGIDHLLFVLALLLIVQGRRRILATITAFTFGHSLTLFAATLGWVHVPGPPVEAAIALSIVFVAAEVVHGLRGQHGMTARVPWVVACTFGLLHGFGFAGALAEVGLPQTAIPIALLMFNVGVEVGQLLFVVGVLTALALWRQVPVRLPRVLADRLAFVPAYSIGALAMFWVFERIAAF